MSNKQEAEEVEMDSRESRNSSTEQSHGAEEWVPSPGNGAIHTTPAIDNRNRYKWTPD